MDVPVNEFAFFQFELTAPIAVRELICSMRNHVVWARSSRVDDLNVWPIWDHLSQKEIGACAGFYDQMQAEMKSKHQDYFRRHLPLAYMTTFSFGMSFRELVKFMTAAFDLNEILEDVAFALLLAVIEKSIPLGSMINDAVSERWYKPHELFPEFKLAREDTEIGAFAFLNFETTLQLRSQLIRHRAILFRDNFSFFFEADNLASPMSSLVNMQAIIPIDFATELIRKRSCWIAQTDLWRPIVEKLNALVAKDKVMLPCDDGSCRFKRDNDLRKLGKDPSPPCPIAAKLEKEKMTSEQKAAAYYYSANRPSVGFWRKVLNDA